MKLSPEQKQTYVSMYILKKMDLEDEEGGMTFPILVPSELSPLDEVLQDLAVHDYIQMNKKKGVYELAPKGVEYLGELIDEAEDLVDEFDDEELADTLRELRARRLDVFRARFLWGWFEGEFDDLVAFQERRGVTPVERMWAFYLTSDAFFDELARDLDES